MLLALCYDTLAACSYFLKDKNLKLAGYHRGWKCHKNLKSAGYYRRVVSVNSDSEPPTRIVSCLLQKRTGSPVYGYFLVIFKFYLCNVK